jgi:putative CocE/NonD family hydrolase
MQRNNELAGQVRVIEHLWIPLADGTRLAARIWLPDAAGADAAPVPAILEYIPYRKRDGTRSRDEPMHHYFASEGFAAVRVDMRGSGESDGLMADEYVLQEQDDALEVIEWIARQRWCSGAVGLMGKSWGGFNALQVAARRPPALKAIITVYSTDDRYADDIHYKGGCLLNDNLWWGSIMLAYQGRPPDPLLYGDEWRAAWLERLDTLPFFPALWMEHPHRDDYWRHGSICEDWSAIQCPVFAIGGWADSYTNAVFRLMDGLQVPRQGLIGPWAHIYPHDGVPGPAVGFLQEAMEWWNRWLRADGPHDAPDRPALRVWMETPRVPQTTYATTPGRWISEAAWPSPAVAMQPLYLGDGTLTRTAPGTATRVLIHTPQGHGVAAGEWMGTGVAGESPADQRIDDGFAQVFDSAPLTEPLALLGMPELEVDVSSDRPVAYLCARLSEVMPDGAVTRVCYSVFNLTHRDGSAEPAALTPGERYRVRLTLDACAHEFGIGNRIRLSLATTYWPLIWPAPEDATVEVLLGNTALHLPVREAKADEPPLEFHAPVRGPATPAEQVRTGSMTRTSSYDLTTGEWTYVTEGVGGLFGEGVQRFTDIDTTVEHNLKRLLQVQGNDPLSARYTLTQSLRMGREGWDILVRSEVQMSSDKERFYLKGTLRAEENGQMVRERSWDETIPRLLL